MRQKDNKFVGLVIQVKNRVSDVLEPLVAESNEVTHHKVNYRYYLKPEEAATFRNAGIDMEKHWPSILFSIGAQENGSLLPNLLPGSGFAHRATS